MEEVAQLSAMKCSATVDAARDTVSAARDTGDLCVKQSLGNDVVESVVNVEKKAICALNQARAAAVCAEDSLAYFRQGRSGPEGAGAEVGGGGRVSGARVGGGGRGPGAQGRSSVAGAQGRGGRGRSGRGRCRRRGAGEQSPWPGRSGVAWKKKKQGQKFAIEG
ncbi:hypothetical protein GUJ93_ZPchr0001g31520 [Zizania palustris]|uniref:Uncharacterized protein n=1 Tax=Zizania palustris TaxID=103762 RepID=A0A8J5VLK9_ZIZPA|nr:hypothetical protein GUJ93_ZPchr0001g31520 [Zizania palustris]